MHVRTLAALAAAAAFVSLTPRTAAAQEQGSESVAMTANRGFRMELLPMVLVPTDKGPLGGGLDLEARYGIKAGPLVFAPGGRLGGYIISERFVGTAMPTLRITVPIGPLAPYGVGGLGGGWLSNPGDSGFAWMAGGGMVIHFGRVVAVGGEVTYQRIQGTDFQSLVAGPTISFGG